MVVVELGGLQDDESVSHGPWRLFPVLALVAGSLDQHQAEVLAAALDGVPGTYHRLMMFRHEKVNQRLRQRGQNALP